MNAVQILKNFVPAKVWQMGRTTVFLLRNHRDEFLNLLVNVRLTSVSQCLLCYQGFRCRRHGFTEIAVRRTRQRVRLRNATSDFDVFRQVYLQNQYAVAGLSRARYVIDAGANVGLTSVYILSRNPKVRIIAIEPDFENYTLAAHNLAPFADRCHLLHAALWSHEQTLGVSRGIFRDGGHWATQTIPELQTCEETVAAYSLQSLLQRFAFPFIDLLKIDIEGAELSIFRDGDTSFLDLTACCAIECHGHDCEQAFTLAAKQYGFQMQTRGDLTIATHP